MSNTIKFNTDFPFKVTVRYRIDAVRRGNLWLMQNNYHWKQDFINNKSQITSLSISGIGPIKNVFEFVDRDVALLFKLSCGGN